MKDVTITGSQTIVIGVIVIWDLIWKGFALWQAAQKKQNGWFIALIIINSVGILPIIYLLINRESKTQPRVFND